MTKASLLFYTNNYANTTVISTRILRKAHAKTVHVISCFFATTISLDTLAITRLLHWLIPDILRALGFHLTEVAP